MPTYQSRPAYFNAEQFVDNVHTPSGVCRCASWPDNAPHMHSLTGTVPVNNLDWIITHPNGDRFVQPDEAFNRNNVRVI